MIITRTPLRVSFLGGNTDFREYFKKYGGLCLSTTIDKYIYCIVKKRFDDLIIVNYSVKEIVKKVVDIKHDLVRESLKMLGIKKGIEISFLADIPSAGIGLGSSSAVTVGLLNALHHYKGDVVSNRRLAVEAVIIEIDILEKPIGEQDQYAIALGGIRIIHFPEVGEIIGHKIKMKESIKEDFNNSLMLFYTNTTRESKDILSSLNIKKSTKILDFNKELANRGIEALIKGDLGAFGRLLDNYWKAKKKLSKKISNEQIDKMYNDTIKAGAIGGKVIGAGGGGFLLTMFPANKRAVIRNKLRDYKELPFRFEEGGSQVIFNIK